MAATSVIGGCFGLRCDANNKASGEVPPTMRTSRTAAFDWALGGFELEKPCRQKQRGALDQALGPPSQVTTERTFSPSRTPARP